MTLRVSSSTDIPVSPPRFQLSQSIIAPRGTHSRTPDGPCGPQCPVWIVSGSRAITEARSALSLNTGMREVTSTSRFGAARRHRVPPRAPEVHVASARCRKPLSPALENSLVLVEKRHEGRFLHLAAGAAALPALPPLAWPLDYPRRPVRIVVPYPAGIAPDIVARVVAQALSQRLKQQFIVDNRPGGASNVGTAAVAHAPPDGYTLLVVTTTNAINTSLYD